MDSNSILALISTLFAQLNQAQARIAELEKALQEATATPKD